MKDVLKPLSKSVLIPLGLIATASTADEDIHKQILVLGIAFIISCKEIKDIRKMINLLKNLFCS